MQLAAGQGFTCTVANVLDFGAGRGRDAVHQLARGLLLALVAAVASEDA